MNRIDQPNRTSERFESEPHRFIEKLYQAAGEQGSKHKEIAAKTAEHVSAGKLPNLQIEGIQHANPHERRTPNKPESEPAHGNPTEQLTPRSNKAEGQGAELANAASSLSRGHRILHNDFGEGTGNTKVGDGTGNTKVGDGPGNTKVGDGPGNTKVGDGPGNTKVGDGPGNTKVGDGPGNTKVGDGPGNTKVGDGTVSLNSQGATVSGTPKSGQ